MCVNVLRGSTVCAVCRVVCRLQWTNSRGGRVLRHKHAVCSPALCYWLTYSLTYCMVQSPSWEANWFAASQEIPRISRNPKVHYRTHNRPPSVSILGQPNSVYIPTSHLLEIHHSVNFSKTSTIRGPNLSSLFQANPNANQSVYNKFQIHPQIPSSILMLASPSQLKSHIRPLLKYILCSYQETIICVCVCNVCMYVCMYVCTYVCMRVYVCMFMYVCMCIYVCTNVCTYVYVCIMYVYLCMYVCMYYMCVRM